MKFSRFSSKHLLALLPTGELLPDRSFTRTARSGLQTSRASFSMTTTFGEVSYTISIHVMKYCDATLIQGVASARRHHLL